jgi:hypothetical protein
MIDLNCNGKVILLRTLRIPSGFGVIVKS